jgi:hypothetical protein
MGYTWHVFCDGVGCRNEQLGTHGSQHNYFVLTLQDRTRDLLFCSLECVASYVKATIPLRDQIRAELGLT